MEEMYCQSCGMPLVKAEDFATNKDGIYNRLLLNIL